MIGKNKKDFFRYINALKQYVDKKEFHYQLQSHPNSNSILAVSDTLLFFNVPNSVYNVEPEQLVYLPERFLALLSINGNESLYEVKKQENKYHFSGKEYTEEEFIKHFKRIVLVVEAITSMVKEKSNTNHLNTLLLCSIVLLSLYTLTVGSFSTALWFLLAAVGLWFAKETFAQTLGIASSLANSFCNAIKGSSCSSVATSTKWGILKKVSLSDISIVFFASQLFISLLLVEDLNQLFTIYSLVMWVSVPVGLISIYYQWKIEKKWCTLCLSIIAILWVQTILLYTVCASTHFVIPFQIIAMVLGVVLFTVVIWLTLKNKFIDNKVLREDGIRHLRFIRNYELFKEKLLQSEKLETPITDYSIILGNKDAKCTITMVTSVFCGHCKTAHQLLSKVISKHEDVKIHICFNVDVAQEEERDNIYKNLHKIYHNNGEYEFAKAIESLYDDTIDKTVFSRRVVESTLTEETVSGQLQKEHNFCEENKIYFTPFLLINGFQFPSLYQREHLEYFIPDLLEDEDIIGCFN